MKKYGCILFDFDGTVADTSGGIKKSIIYACTRMGLTPPQWREMDVFIGPPLLDSFSRVFGLDGAHAKRMVEFYREDYTPNGLKNYEIYPGITECLRLLSEKGVRCGVTTSKPTFMAEGILKESGICRYFDFVVGATLDHSRDTKSEVLNYAACEYSIDKVSAILVGDTKYDIIGAHGCGIDALGVLYGFGTKEELSRENPEFIVNDTAELYALLDEITRR